MQKTRRIFLLVGLALCLSVNGFARKIDSTQAVIVARSFARAHFPSDTGMILKSVMTQTGNGPAFLYFFSVADKGFILVGADDRMPPIVAWSDETSGGDTPPPGAVHWLDMVAHDSYHATADTTKSRYADRWQALLAGQHTLPEKTTSVAPMLITTWNQNGRYNADCPFDSTTNARTLTGCVATVMAQMMRYWQWPQWGIGFHAYQDAAFGILSANFGHTKYNWSAMPGAASFANPAIATIMYHAGVSVNMDYGVQASTSYVLANNCPIRYNAQFALENYFCYQHGIRGLYRQDFTESAWIQLVQDELLAGRPVIYNGTNDSEGHSFIADGFDAENRFHFNWGWGGSWNGYYSVDSLTPDGISFMKTNTVLTGIQPDRARSLIMAGNTLASDQVYSYRPIALSSRILNTGTTAYSGNVTAVLTGDDYPYFSQSVTLPGISLASGDSSSLLFAFAGMGPGAYHVQLWYNSKLVDSTAEFQNNDAVMIYGDSLSTACTVFPNPAYDYAYVSLNQSGATGYQIMSLSGRTVSQGHIAADAPVLALPVRFLEAGMYLVDIETIAGPQHLKVCVAH